MSPLILDALSWLIRAAGAVALLALAAYGCWALRRGMSPWPAPVCPNGDAACDSDHACPDCAGDRQCASDEARELANERGRA